MKELIIDSGLTWEKFSKELDGASLIINNQFYAYGSLEEDGVFMIEMCNFRVFVKKKDFTINQSFDEDEGYPFTPEWVIILRNKSFLIEIESISIATELDELAEFCEKFC